jgi:peroxiredoxin
MDTLGAQLRAADERWIRHWLQGPTHTRQEAVPAQMGDPAPDVDLVDQDGEPASLSGFWRDGPAVLFFMRHYGCSCMKERWGQLRDEISKLEEAGGRLVAVGMGEPERTRLFIRHRQIPVPVLCDPEGKAYRAYGIVEGTVPAILHDFEWKPDDEETGRKLAESRRDTDLRLVDNPWLLPAEFVVDKEGVIRHAHRYQYCEDYPPTTVLIGAIKAAS